VVNQNICITIGMYRGKAMKDLPTEYLFWLVAKVRSRYPRFAKAALEVIQSRLEQNFDSVVSELIRSPEQIAAERAEKRSEHKRKVAAARIRLAAWREEKARQKADLSDGSEFV